MTDQKDFEKRIKEADVVITNLINERRIITKLSEPDKIY